MTDLDHDDLSRWVGRHIEHVDAMDPFAARALAAALDRERLPESGDLLPPVWHWLYFLAAPSAASTREDGHPALEGGLLPPTLPPRRMWAASELHFDAPLIVGTPARRRSTIVEIEAKTGRTGPLVFVHVEHVVSQLEVPRVRERQTLVYRPAATGPHALGVGDPAPGTASWENVVRPDPVLLFRYSALTYNAHRIHYDRSYATSQEHFAGLVVHGPLIATLLLELVARRVRGRTVRSFRFRAQRPAFEGEALHVCGEPDGNDVTLWTKDATGAIGTTAHALLASAW